MSKTLVQSDIAARLERLPLSWPHRKLLLIHGFGWFFDAMDVGLFTYIAVAILKDWGLSNIQLGLLHSAGIFGMCVGSGVAGWLGDKFGRKTVFQVTLLIYAVATALCATAPNVPTLMFMRFLVGIGLGGEFPVVASLLSEFIPGKQRGRYIVFLQSFWVWGWLVANVIGYLLIPTIGWRLTFLVGAAPAIYIWVIRRNLPESPRWYASQGRMDEAQKVVAQLEREVEHATGAPLPPVSEEATVHITENRKVPLREIWSRQFRRRTVMLWVLWFCLIYAFYGIASWQATLIYKEHHYTLEKALFVLIIVSIAQIPGYFSAAYLIERVGRKPVIIGFLIPYAITAFFFGRAQGDFQIILWCSLMNFCNLGAWGAIYSYTSELYPTEVRATGAGSATAFGRVGGIISPLAIGFLLGPFGKPGVLTMIAAFPIVGALIVWILGRETRGKSLEAASAPEPH